jgi:hypothetical protein
MSHGTWQTTGGGGGPAAGLVAVAAGAAVVAAAVVSWIMTRLLLITLIGVALAVIAVMVVLVMRRIRHPEGAVQLSSQRAALGACADLRIIQPRPAAGGITYHGGTHVHIEAGADEAAALIRNAVTGNPLVITDKENY